MTIAERQPFIQLMLGNRTDLDDRIPVWTAKAYIELASNIPFADLEDTDILQTAAGVDLYEYPDNAMGILACTLTFQSSPRSVRKKNIEYVDLYPTASQGVPVVWAPFNYQQVFRPVPDQAYSIIRRFWTKPVVDFTSTETINDTDLLVPDNWLEILDYTSAMRGHTELKEISYAQELRMLLYGDPKHPADNPGLIKERLTQIQAESVNADYALRMRIRPYTTK